MSRACSVKNEPRKRRTVVQTRKESIPHMREDSGTHPEQPSGGEARGGAGVLLFEPPQSLIECSSSNSPAFVPVATCLSHTHRVDFLLQHLTASFSHGPSIRQGDVPRQEGPSQSCLQPVTSVLAPSDDGRFLKYTSLKSSERLTQKGDREGEQGTV